MIRVACTVVFVLGTGYRQVKELDGIVVNTQDQVALAPAKILVDFGPQVPVGPEAVWVNDNDCVYYDNPEQTHDYLDGLKEVGKEFADETYKKAREKLIKRRKENERDYPSPSRKNR